MILRTNLADLGATKAIMDGRASRLTTACRPTPTHNTCTALCAGEGLGFSHMSPLRLAISRKHCACACEVCKITQTANFGAAFINFPTSSLDCGTTFADYKTSLKVVTSADADSICGASLRAWAERALDRRPSASGHSSD